MANKRPWEALDDLLIVKSGCVRIFTILCIVISAVGASSQSPRDSKIEDLLKKLNKQPIKTLQSSDGEIIDCVDIYKQPAFDNPLLKNHTIEMRPSFDPGMGNRSNYSSEYAEPIWRLNGSCLKRTIPIRRVRKSDLFQAKSLERFETVHPNPFTNTARALDMAGGYLRSHYLSYYGVRGYLSIWKPWVDNRETSTSSITIAMLGPNSRYTLQAGWTVNARMFGNDVPHLFVSWTAWEGNNVRRCINLRCPGFIQTNSDIVLGSPLPFSTNNILEMLRVEISKGTHNTWWVMFNGEEVGYYPPEIFHNFNLATTVDWRGEVWNMRTFGHHTNTGMGSGEFADMHFGRAAHFEDMAYAISYNHFIPVQNLEIVQSFPYCYNAILHPPQGATSTSRLFFGGPGGPTCDQ